MRISIPLVVVAFSLAVIGCEADQDQPDPSPDEAVASDEVDEMEPESGEDGSHETDEEELAEDLEPGETRHFGEPFTIDDDPIPLQEALAQLDDPDEEGAHTSQVKVEARVEQVCKKKGCWFTLDADDVDRPVRVRMKDYLFFVPRNTEGATSIIEGQLEVKVIDEELAQHYAEDVAEHTGEDPAQVEGEQKTYRFTSTGISMSLPES